MPGRLPRETPLKLDPAPLWLEPSRRRKDLEHEADGFPLGAAPAALLAEPPDHGLVLLCSLLVLGAVATVDSRSS